MPVQSFPSSLTINATGYSDEIDIRRASAAGVIIDCADLAGTVAAIVLQAKNPTDGTWASIMVDGALLAIDITADVTGDLVRAYPLPADIYPFQFVRLNFTSGITSDTPIVQTAFSVTVSSKET